MTLQLTSGPIFEVSIIVLMPTSIRQFYAAYQPNNHRLDQLQICSKEKVAPFPFILNPCKKWTEHGKSISPPIIKFTQSSGMWKGRKASQPSFQKTTHFLIYIFFNWKRIKLALFRFFQNKKFAWILFTFFLENLQARKSTLHS